MFCWKREVNAGTVGSVVGTGFDLHDLINKAIWPFILFHYEGSLDKSVKSSTVTSHVIFIQSQLTGKRLHLQFIRVNIENQMTYQAPFVLSFQKQEVYQQCQ